MGLAEIAIVLLWLPQAAAQVLIWTHWIQVKEYRFDRFRSFIFSAEGKKKLYLPLIIFKIIVFIVSSVAITDSNALIIVMLMFLNLYYVYLLKEKKLRKPVFTQRMIKILTVCTIVSVLTLFISLSLTVSIAVVLSEILLILSIFLGILFTIPVVNKVKTQETNKAIEKLEKISPIVIGITGSYGKTTTKEFLSSILAKEYFVEKTKKNENTVFGVARRIINDLPQKTEIFVAEMGAYHKGEIRSVAEMTKPQIGIITGIEPQHIDLFGSIENIMDAKFELIEALPKNAVAVFNLSNEDVRELYRRAQKLPSKLKVYGYILHKSIGKRYGSIVPHIESKIIESNEDGVWFELFENGKSIKLFAPVTGIHFIENITGAILVARQLNLSWERITSAVKELELPEKTMQVNKLGYGSLLIDDSYNSTPKGFLSALDYLSYFKNKSKVVITPGIIELGDKSKGIHKMIGQQIENKTDYAIITNYEPYKYLRSGYLKDKERITVIENEAKLLDAVEKLIENGTVLLIEGRISSKVYDFIVRRKR